MRCPPFPRILSLPLIAASLLVLGAGESPSSLPATAPATTPATTPATRAAPLAYRWRLINDSVGGPCSGLVFTSQDAAIRYTYGFTGGYRWDTLMQRWTSLTDWNPEPDYGRVVGLAIDPNDRNVVYYAAGTTRGEVFKSVDRGNTFVATGLRAPDGGAVSFLNWTGRPTTGERLIVDSINSKIVYLATVADGLWVSDDAGAAGSWKPVASFTARGDPQNIRRQGGDTFEMHALVPNGGLSFVTIDRRGGAIEVGGVRRSRTIFVGVIGDRRLGDGEGRKILPESGVWRSNDGGQSWTRLAGDRDRDLSPTRAQIAADGDLWATVSDKVINIPRGGGASAVLPLPGNGLIIAMAVDRLDPNHAVVARYGTPPKGVYGEENKLFRTIDGGVTWTELKVEAATPAWWGKFATRTAVLRFEPNSPKDEHGRTRTLWLGDELGPWVCNDLDAEVTHWKLINRGRGGTFILALASPPAVEGRITAPLFAASHAFCGFRYLGVTATPEARFESAQNGQGWLESISFCETDPRIVAGAVFDGNPHNAQRAVARISRDNGVQWQDVIDPAAHEDGAIVVGSGVKENRWPTLLRWPEGKPPRVSRDGGATWSDGAGAPAAPRRRWQMLANPNPGPLADPVDADRFYLLTEDSGRPEGIRVFVSRDGGGTWKPALPGAAAEPPHSLPSTRAAAGAGSTQSLQWAATPGKSGDLWVAQSTQEERSALLPATQPTTEPIARQRGLLHSSDGGAHWASVPGWEEAYCVSFGAPPPGGKSSSVVVSGAYKGKLGIFLCEDASQATGEGAKWQQIWDLESTDTPALRHCLREIAADRQAFGRVYTGATGAPRGLFYGEPIPQSAPATPTNIAVIAGLSGVTVQWTDPVGSAEYDVQRATVDRPGEWTTVVTSAWQARVVDSSAKTGATYLYRVIASNALGRSEPSAVVRSD